jgi:delta 1-pyrroline-5-carboxylate dehydrogenase
VVPRGIGNEFVQQSVPPSRSVSVQNTSVNASQEVLATLNLTLHQLHGCHDDELKFLFHKHNGKIPQAELRNLNKLEQHNPDAMQALVQKISSLTQENSSLAQDNSFLRQLSKNIEELENERFEIVHAAHMVMIKVRHELEKASEVNITLVAEAVVEIQGVFYGF